MKATMQADGILHVEAETELEQYALRQWAGDNLGVNMQNCKLQVSWSDRLVVKPGPAVVQHGKCIICGNVHGIGLPCPRNVVYATN